MNANNDAPVTPPIQPATQPPPKASADPHVPSTNNPQSPLLMPELPKQPDKKHSEGLRGVLSTIAIIVLAPLIALALTAFVFQSYEVDGISMATTLSNQDRLIIFKVPRTWAKITGQPYVPQRGDIIVFNLIDEPNFGASQKRQLVKRVIALPGDHITIKDKNVKIINKERPEGFNPDKTLGYANAIKDMTGNVDLTVPEDKIFVMGDNRFNSLDSRSFGPVPIKDIVGVLGVRIFPFNKAKLF